MPDAMFTSSGGKGRLAPIAECLRKLGVSVAIVADFDLLRDSRLLENLVRAQGGQWERLEKRWSIVNAAVGQALKKRTVDQVRDSLGLALGPLSGDAVFTKQHAKSVAPVVKVDGAWDAPKQHGLRAVPSGQATVAATELLGELRELQIHVIESGELESFDRSTARKSALWVDAVLERDLLNAPELRAAREFVSRLFPSPNTESSSARMPDSAAESSPVAAAGGRPSETAAMSSPASRGAARAKPAAASIVDKNTVLTPFRRRFAWTAFGVCVVGGAIAILLRLLG